MASPATEPKNLYNDIKKQLVLLEDAFYDGMPNELLYHPHIGQFAHRMDIIHKTILNIIANHNIPFPNTTRDAQETTNIDYSQLEALGYKKN